MSEALDAVIEFLEAEQARGVSHVLLDDEARDGLRNLYRITQQSEKKQVTRISPTHAQAAVLNGKPIGAAVLYAASEREVIPSRPDPVISTMVTIEGNHKSEKLSSLRRQAENWAPAKALGSLRDILVFSTGNADAKVMFVGEAPGYEEEKQRQPFMGPAGQKLNDIMKAMGLEREQVYLANIVKFRPATARQTTNNRKPNPAEMAAWLPFIRAEVQIVSPVCLVALGNTAADALLGITGAVADVRGAWHQFEGIPLRVTYHPSYLLQTGANLAVKRQLWEDMLAVMEMLKMPISEKQRGFFLPKS